MTTIHVSIVDDQRLFREGIASLLSAAPGIRLTGQYENGRAFAAALSLMERRPDVLLVDMNMPEMNGVELTELLQRKHPEIKVIILSVHDQERFVYKMVEAGAAGYLFKNCDIEEVLVAIDTVYRSGFYFNDAVIAAMRNGSRYKGAQLHTINNIPVELTEREKEVLQLICRELTNAEIAEKLHLSPRTVDGHRNNLLAKTSSRNTAGLVLFAVANDLFEVMKR